MIVLGCDPGLDGALCLMGDDQRISLMFDMPTLSLSRSGKSKREINPHTLARIIHYNPSPVGHAFIEQLWGMGAASAGGGQSASSAFAFGKGYGVLIGVLAALGVPMTFVAPKAWKKALSVPASKDGARARASQLLPLDEDRWPLKKHDGRAESALIALWGIRSLNGIARGEAASTEEQKKYSDENRCSATSIGSLAPSVDRP